jgi:hypothetical protein
LKAAFQPDKLFGYCIAAATGRARESITHRRGVDSVYCFRGAMSSNNRLGGSPLQQRVEQSREAQLVRIAHGTLAIGLDPFGMLDPQIVVNLLPEFGVGVDLVIHGYWPGERFKCGATVRTMGPAESLTGTGAVSARYGQVRVFQRAARTCLRCVRRRANWISLSRWRCSNTASSPLCVRVGVNLLITSSFVFLVRRRWNLPRR